MKAPAGFSVKLCGPRGRSPNTQAAGMNQYCTLSSVTILYQYMDADDILITYKLLIFELQIGLFVQNKEFTL